MDNYLIPIAVGLLIMCGVLVYLAEQSRREARRWKALYDQAKAQAGKQRQLAHDDGLFMGYKRGWGESYTAACKAERRGLSAIDAVMRVGKLNAPALLSEPDEALLVQS